MRLGVAFWAAVLLALLCTSASAVTLRRQDPLMPLWVNAPDAKAAKLSPVPIPKPINPPEAPADGNAAAALYPPAPVPPPPPPPIVPPPVLGGAGSGSTDKKPKK